MRTLGSGKAIFGSLVMICFLASCTRERTHQQEEQRRAQTRAAQDEATIRSLDAEWAKAAAAKDPAKMASFYAEDGELLAPGASLASGKEVIEKTWQALMSTPGFALGFAPTKIGVSASGDLAYDLGEYSLTVNDKRGRPQTNHGKYVVVWGKQADGSWKALLDVPTTTQ